MKRPTHPAAAFSMAEMLTVIGLLVLLMMLSTLGLGRMMAARRLEEGGRLVLEELQRARQLAAGRNVRVEVRFEEAAREGGDPPTFHRLRTGVIDRSGVFTPVGALTRLPVGVVLASDTALSPIIAAQPPETSGTAAYTAIVIRPNGMLEPRTGLSLAEPWFVTVVPERDRERPPGELVDFATLQIDPWTARATLHAP